MKKRIILISSIFIFLSINLIIAQNQNSSSIDTTNYGKNDIIGKYNNSRGFKMYYEVYGKGAPLLLIHGNGGSINNFSNQIPFFSKEYKVIIADSRSQGRSIDLSDTVSYEMMADDINSLLDSLHIDSCYVIGWSDGGINGLLLAIRHPEKVKKLAITGANLWPDTTAVDTFAYHQSIRKYEKYKKFLSHFHKENNYNILESYSHLKVIRLLPYEPHISINDLKKIKCPTLVIGGDHDVILPVHTLLIAESIPNSYLWIIPNSGHATPIFHKDQFNNEIDLFFKSPYRKIEGRSRFQ